MKARFAGMVGAELRTARHKQRWTIIFFFCFSGVLTATWASRIPAIQLRLGLNNAALGSVLFAIPAGLIAGLSVASWLIATFGARKVLITSCLFSAVLLFMAGWMPGTFPLVLVLFLLGFGRTIFNLAANTSAIDVQRLFDTPIISSFHGTWSLACLAAAGVAQLLIMWDIAPLFHFMGVAIVVAILGFLLAGKKEVQHFPGEKRPFFVKPDKYLFLLGLVALCAMLCEGAMFDWSVNYFEKVVRVEKSMVTAGYIAFISMMTGGRLVGDRLIHSFGPYRVLAVNGCLMSIGFALAASFPFIIPAAIGFLLIGLGDSIVVPIIYMLASKSDKMPTGYALSSVTLIGYSGFLMGPLLIGNVSQQFGMPAAFFILSGASLLMVALTLKVKRLAQAV